MSLKFIKFINDFRHGDFPFKVLYQLENLAVPIHFDNTVISMLENKNLKTDKEIIEELDNFLDKSNFEEYLRSTKEVKEKITKPNVILTDIQFHTSYSQNKKSFGRNIDRSIKNKEPGRFYFDAKNLKLNENGIFEMIIPIKDLDKYSIEMVKDMPLLAGKDTIEKINSIKSK